jgi:hypothetical protein
MHNILIGIRRDLAVGLEKFLQDKDYQKLVEDETAYFKFNLETDDTSEIISYLKLFAGEDNYGFVRLGSRVDDTEVSGTLENFDMVVNRTAEIL